MMFVWNINHIWVYSVIHLHIEAAPDSIQGTSTFCSEWKTEEELNAAFWLSGIKSIRRPNWSVRIIRRSTIPNSMQGKRLAREGRWLSALSFVIAFSNPYSPSVELFSELFLSSTASRRELRSLYLDFHRITLFSRFQIACDIFGDRRAPTPVTIQAVNPAGPALIGRRIVDSMEYECCSRLLLMSNLVASLDNKFWGSSLLGNSCVLHCIYFMKIEKCLAVCDSAPGAKLCSFMELSWPIWIGARVLNARALVSACQIYRHFADRIKVMVTVLSQCAVHRRPKFIAKYDVLAWPMRLYFNRMSPALQDWSIHIYH